MLMATPPLAAPGRAERAEVGPEARAEEMDKRAVSKGRKNC